VSDNDWFRNEVWSSSVEERFEQRLRRARRKDEYLRLQAYHLLASHPEVALQLAERCLALNSRYSPAPVLDVRAKALANLGRVEEAVEGYEQVLACEASRPNTMTNAFADMAELVVVHDLRHHYERVLSVLDTHADRLVFPALRFVHYACRGVIFFRRNELALAHQEAKAALAEASQQRSGLTYHPNTGLVGDRYAPLLQLLRPFCDA
jgi:tetratricopeptide (TPR) repeat protein